MGFPIAFLAVLAIVAMQLWAPLAIAGSAAEPAAGARPNVILLFMDNFAYGELGSYGGGIIRGAPTPRLDALAGEGLRLTNFNVEAQCVPSRAALMTGRYALRTGNAKVPFNRAAPYGLTQWEYTMAEMFSEAGYSTAMYGKWHLGDRPGRLPTDQGFEEWWGIPNSTDETWWESSDRIPAEVRSAMRRSEILAATRGAKPTVVKPYDLAERPLVDGELTDRAVSYIERNAGADCPFFLYVPFTLTHQPRLPRPEFAGKTGNGVWADLLAQIDSDVGRILDAVDRSDIANDTIVIFTSDNGGDFFDDGSFPGPWRGTYFTGLEGSLRVPFLIRWPGKIPAGRVSNEIVHEMDLLPTLAGAAGGRLPADRIIDGLDQLAFFQGRQERSNRDSVIVYVGDQLYAVKWRNWKGVLKELDSGYGKPVGVYQTPTIYDLYLDPREERPLAGYAFQQNGWVAGPMMQVLANHLATLRQEPPIPEGTADPYVPAKATHRPAESQQQGAEP